MTKNAREKLNSIYMAWIFVVATIVGLISGSWGLFLIAIIILIAASIATNEIRFPPQRPRRRR